jgi:hypothetical protein
MLTGKILINQRTQKMLITQNAHRKITPVLVINLRFVPKFTCEYPSANGQHNSSYASYLTTGVHIIRLQKGGYGSLSLEILQRLHKKLHFLFLRKAEPNQVS